MLEDMKRAVEEVASCKVIDRVQDHPDTTEKDIELIKSYMEDPAWGHYQLSNALRKKGINVHKDSIIRHREKRCPCWKE